MHTATSGSYSFQSSSESGVLVWKLRGQTLLQLEVLQLLGWATANTLHLPRQPAQALMELRLWNAKMLRDVLKTLKSTPKAYCYSLRPWSANQVLLLLHLKTTNSAGDKPTLIATDNQRVVSLVTDRCHSR
jgi:hypothetical protein